MRVGIVCPYSFDVPGGVQFHIRDLAEHLMSLGHVVSVLAPADDDTPVPAYVEPAGRAVPVPYNGSVARVSFGPVSNARVRRWLAEGDFDVVHIHEPITPSLALLALWNATGPIVATFHTAILRSRAMQAAYPVVRPSLEKISARIAVSEDARRTLVEHLGGDAVVIPNGVYVDRFASAPVAEEWEGTEGAPTLAFLGRLDEPRKGLEVLCRALPALLSGWPDLRVLVAGRGDADEALEVLGEAARSVTFLGAVSDEAKASLLRSVDVYVAPQTGGESFGIVLVEAMSAGTCVVASDLGAFRRVLDDGEFGLLFPTGDPDALATAVASALADPGRRAELAAAGQAGVRRYDWSIVAADVLAVYETVVPPAPASVPEPRPAAQEPGETGLRALLSRWRS
ncbi:MAG: glycosyltransferase family 4 protein [Actinomycetes bacterium]